MQIKLEFAFGTQFDAAGATIDPALAMRAVEQLRLKLADLAGGCSAFAHIGTWIDPEGKRVDEHGYTLTAVLETNFHWTADFVIQTMVTDIKTRLNQQGVAVTQTLVDFVVL